MYSNIYFDNLPTHALGNADHILPALSAFVDGQNLSCPMPLLKTKIALKAFEHGQVYTVSTDPNSVQDLTVFCQKNTLQLTTWQNEYHGKMVFHFLIKKHCITQET